MRKYKVGLIGIGGFGRVHADTIMDLAAEGYLELTAFAEPYIHLSKATYDKLISAGARHYSDYNDMLQSHPDIDFITIATPIHLHKDMSIAVMEKGFNVLLEKPPAVTIQDIDAIIQVQRLSGKLCAVNFQNTSGKAFQMLLEKVKQGILGEIQSITGVGMWKRTQAYYSRTAWAGKLVVNGKYILDGTINNPFAHLLNNCLIIAGYGNTTNAAPHWVQAELYKAHNIAGEDTSCVRIYTINGVEIRFFATLCNKFDDIPYISVQGSKGKAYWNFNNLLQITDEEGNKENYLFGQENLFKNIYDNLIDVLGDNNKQLFSSIESCRSFILASNGAFESCGRTIKIPEEHLIISQENDTVATYIKDIEEIFQKACSTGKLFSEVSAAWASTTKPFPMKGYNCFNLFL
ncbi:MAG: hypothetical protein PWR27_1063 [Petroclostridium sp.]|jgi:predicted dehydrogenase|uniref:Gfo/Idh/MocA family protein n=1 Tax=Petroclostridium xylanilyticum TaxID=1792311 RepID=UPI000B98C700|nr:Gfo/Idh/MocA family oxidoreductase [Petroclostridium xylanilyticum]MBZ4645322.1 oxidoreductase domain protein [Clostridia bacterium]MDK2810354.1 hypothetical protein [Petroclostridium sp.]